MPMLRLPLLLVCLSALSVVAYISYTKELYFCMFFLLIVSAGMIAYIYHRQNRTLRMMQRLLESIRYTDFSLNYSIHHKNRLERQVAEDINRVVEQFRKQLTEREERYLYYETLLESIDSGILVTDKRGNIQWMNYAAINDLTGGTRIHHVNELGLLNPELPSLLQSLTSGDIRTFRMQQREALQEMAVTVTIYQSKGNELRLVSLKNIHPVLEKNEIDAWQKLIRVLTHEIMNSIAPILSLSETLSERAVLNGVNERDYAIMQQAMQTIHRRSKGLLGFVENYRKLTRISMPKLSPVRVGELMGDMRKLFPDGGEVRYVYTIDNLDIIMLIDRAQIEQVLINLLKNAAEACSFRNDGQVTIGLNRQRTGYLYLTIADNGPGILPDVIDKVFIPFFTTKSTGSGIGLSLCKQIMTMHGGSISVSSEEGKGSCFTLKFKG